ncbi:MAG: DUF4123 domain-containing protein, partial [Gammaproteobacteria bacterium]|nr:DUF4123 domain-containing protein [Gammaproteobacteria bacterium]
MDDKKQAHTYAQEMEMEHNSISFILKQQFHHFAHSQTTEHLYLLFNSASHQQLPQQYYALEAEQHYIGLLQDLLDGYNEQSIPVMPYLVEINRNTLEQNPFIDWLLSTPETRGSFFALTSRFDLSTIAAHWDSIALVHSSRQQTVILRLFDGRISQQFLSQISKYEQQQLLGPCQSLWFPNESGEAILMQNASAIKNPQTAPWFHLSQHHEILLAGDENKTLNYNLTLYLWENHADALSQYSAELIDQLIELGLKKARALGYTSAENIYFCVALFFYYSPIFYQHNLI